MPTALLLMLALLATAAAAQPLADDPKRPVEAIARDLQITPQQFRECFAQVQPAPEGTRPSTERVRINKSVLLSCLQRANPTITNGRLDTVMDRFRPGGREAQRPPR